MSNEANSDAIKEKIHELYVILESLDTMQKAVIKEQDILSSSIIQQNQAIITIALY